MKNISKYIGVLAIFMLTACGTDKEEQEILTESSESNSMSKNEFDKMGLELGNPQIINISELISVNGMVDVPPENIAEVSYPLSGFIKALGHNILEGRFVKKGSTLATVQSMELIQLQQDYLEFYNQRTYFAQELERQKAMNAENAGSKKALQEAENKYKVNQSMIASYEAKLRLLSLDPISIQNGKLVSTVAIRAPFSGFIQKVHVHTGTNFTPDNVMFEMISKNHLHVELKVFEKDAYKLKKGQKVSFNAVGTEDELEGEVFLVGQSFESESRAINVHVHIPNSKLEQQLIPGQYLSGSIHVDSREVLALPESSLLREEGKAFVYETTKNTDSTYEFSKKQVTIGTIQNEMVEIISPSGLKEVVVKKVTFLAGGFEE